MEEKRLKVPDHQLYDDAYRLSYRIAAEKIAGLADIEEQCRRSGAQYQPAESTITISYLNRACLITLPDVRVALADSPEEIPIRDKLLILHYFLTAKGTPLASRLITFRELPEGAVYYPTFLQRTVKPILDNFAKNPALLVEAAQPLGGRPADYGDAAVTINAFSRVPVTIVLWRGDEELPPQGSVLVDAGISDYLPTEDITVLCETIAWRLVRYPAGKKSDTGLS